MTDQPKDPKVVEIKSRTITQQELIECLSFKILYERKRDAITAAIKSGASIEGGVHEAHLHSKLIIR